MILHTLHTPKKTIVNVISTIFNNTTNNTNTLNTSDLIAFHSNIEQMKGHIQQALINKEAGNNTLTVAHTLHPIDEIYSLIQRQLSEADPALNGTLASSLISISQNANNLSLQEFRQEAEQVNNLLNQSIAGVVPETAQNNVTHVLGVIGDLVSIASDGYAEAVENGSIKEMIEYQDAQAFTNQSRTLLNSLIEVSSAEMARANQTIEEVKRLFVNLDKSVQNREDLKTVSEIVNDIISKIGETI